MTGKFLLIMRHAKSDWSAGLPDIERPLNKRGVKSAEKISRWLQKNDMIPGKIISSPSRRTRETVNILCEHMDLDDRIIEWDDRIYEADLADLLNVLDDMNPEFRCQLLVGHNPGLDSLVCHLSSTTPMRNSTGKLMTTAALAVFDYGKHGLNSKKHSARLVQIIRPRELP